MGVESDAEAEWLLDVTHAHRFNWRDPRYVSGSSSWLIGAHMLLFSRSSRSLSPSWRGGRPLNVSRFFEVHSAPETICSSGEKERFCYALTGRQLTAISCNESISGEVGAVCKKPITPPEAGCMNECPAGFMEKSYSNSSTSPGSVIKRCYFINLLTSPSKSWYEALAVCRNMDMELYSAEFDGELLNIFIEQYELWVNAHSTLYNYKDSQSSRLSLYWPNGSTPSSRYHRYEIREPNGEQCGLTSGPSSFRYARCSCPLNIGYICKARVCNQSQFDGNRVRKSEQFQRTLSKQTEEGSLSKQSAA